MSRTECLWLVLLLPLKQAASLEFRHHRGNHRVAMAFRNASSRRRFVGGAALTVPPLLLQTNKARAESDEGQRSTSPIVPGGGPVKFRPAVEGPSWNPQFSLQTSLAKSRIQASELRPLEPSLLPFADQELYYAPFLFGEWNTTATLRQKTFPYGVDFVPSQSLVEGSPRNRQESVGDTTSYQLRFFSTLADTVSNKVAVNLGTGVPQSKIIADRAFDAISLSTAYKQLTPVQDVDWNPSKDPTRLTLSFGAGPLTEDMRPLGQRRGEVYITARQSDQIGDDVYCVAERSRSVTLAPGNVIVSDTETITEFRMVRENDITAISRIAVYLTPNPNSREGVLWQQVGGKAVAFFDYEIQMSRNEQEFILGDGRAVKRACVRTPKDVVQCE